MRMPKNLALDSSPPMLVPDVVLHPVSSMPGTLLAPPSDHGDPLHGHIN